MNVEDFKYTVKSSWIAAEAKDPADVISLGHAADPTERSDEYEGEIHHEIKPKNLVRFTGQGDEEPFAVNIQILEPDWTITKISVVSEVRIIELYGHHGEYIATSRGSSLSEGSEKSLYNSQPDVSVRHELCIKFPGAKDSIWIYGIKLLVKKLEIAPTAGIFDYRHVDEMLSTSKMPITDKAEQAKQFLQKYSNTLLGGGGGTSQKQPDPRAIMKILEGEYRSHIKPMEDAGRNVSQYIASFMLAKNKKDTESESTNDVKAYVDSSVKQLEERIQNNLKLQLEAFEEKQNQKLDAIIQLLASKT